MMTRSRCVSLLATLTACGCAAAGAQQPTPTGDVALARPHIYEVAPEQVAPGGQQLGTVEVSGSGSVSVSPDQAVVSFAVETREEHAAEASGANAESMAAVLEALRSADLPGLVLETYGYSLRPEYGVVQEGGRSVRVIEGYAALNNVRATVEDPDAVGRVIDAAIGAGANRVSGIAFRASETEAAGQEALAMAVENARAQADAIAAALGHELGPALEVRGGSAVPRPGPEIGIMLRAQAADIATPIEAADQAVTATVTIKYALGPRRSGR